HTVDGQTVALYRFDEGSGTTISDATGGSPGVRQFGGSPAGPVYVADIPFSGTLPSATPTRTATPISGPLPLATSTPTATPTMTSVAFTATVTSTPTRTTNPTITPIVGIPSLKPRAFLPFVQKP
ncbi:MAG: LamG domain-containing protein, partial [Roseiflexus sp.]